ncbi:unnamed protein product [Caenorhabditis angaria]|uniref:Reverse transcriptase domain-containing protein n=1 Tax=Caenorhabditis angaria TaxID=860376 RepID=A0A9P1ILV5_9PELO|nr:unnamed protein product [Caenorhabditis angaria]
MFFLEETHREELDYNDDAIRKEFENTVKMTDEGICVRWPWKPFGKEQLGDNREVAYRRLVNMVQSKKSAEKLKSMRKILDDQLERRCIEEISLEEIENSRQPVYYMPIQLVRNENSETSKDRIVYDGSSKKKGTKSLNECLAQGPVSIPKVHGIILKARTSNLVLTADVEKAFHTLTLHEDDRNTTLFMFLRDINKPPTNENIIIYRFRKVPFGIISSPYLLSESIKFSQRDSVKMKNLRNALKTRCT